MRCDWSDGTPDEIIQHNDKVADDTFVTLGRGRTVREAIDAARAFAADRETEE